MTAAETMLATVTCTRVGETGHLTLSGQLNATTLPQVWAQALAAVQPNPPPHLMIDVSQLTYCDGAGLGLFAELRRIVATAGGKTELVGPRPELQRFLEMSVLKDPLAKQLLPGRQLDAVTQFGKSAFLIFKDLLELVAFTGELTATLIWSMGHPRKIRFKDVLLIADKAGASALPVVSLLGLLVGIILAFQTAGPLARYGAQPLIPTIVSVAVIREMGPLITAIILAGRSGSAFAAEIGTMQVTEELSALKTLGFEPVRFLVIPRVLAALLVTPILTVFNMALSLLGAYFVMASLGYSLNFYLNSVQSAITYTDLLGGVFKSVIFALIISGIGCLRGIQTKSGPGAVGDSTTRAVVAGIVLTIAADAVIGVVYYNLGI